MITADNITDEQIRELQRSTVANPLFITDGSQEQLHSAERAELMAIYSICEQALEYETMHWIRDERCMRLRARCAEILNARAGKVQP